MQGVQRESEGVTKTFERGGKRHCMHSFFLLSFFTQTSKKLLFFITPFLESVCSEVSPCFALHVKSGDSVALLSCILLANAYFLRLRAQEYYTAQIDV